MLGLKNKEREREKRENKKGRKKEKKRTEQNRKRHPVSTRSKTPTYTAYMIPICTRTFANFAALDPIMHTCSVIAQLHRWGRPFAAYLTALKTIHFTLY